MDGAGENLSSDVMLFRNMHEIHLENSPACAPQSNEAAERLIQEHWTQTRTLIFTSNLLNKF